MKSLARDSDRQELLRRLQRISSESPRRWGKMSAHQMICHLDDSFKAGTGEKPVGSSTSFLRRTVVKWIGLYLPIPWPKGIPTRPEMSQELGGTRPTEFEADRQRLIHTIERFAAISRDFAWQAHPLFGRMSERDWWRWGYLHTDHHLRQFGL
jgi:hypothetical protein